MSVSGVGELAMIAALVVLVLWHPKIYPIRIPSDEFDMYDDYCQKLIAWERDRVLSLAKGIAGAAASYLLALLPAILKHEINVQVSPFMIVGTLVGALGLFVLACDISVATSEFTRHPMKPSGMSKAVALLSALWALLSKLLVIWLIIGAIAAGQRGYYNGTVGSCSKAGTIAVTILAGPLNYRNVNHYRNVNPKINCTVPQPKK